MLEVTPQDIVNGDWDEIDPSCQPYCVYVISEGNLILYVGTSTDPFSRITEHFGHSLRGNSQIQTICRAYPEVMTQWKVRFYTLHDCEPHVMQDFPYPVAQYHKPRLAKAMAEVAERAMIKNLRPCLNVKDNNHASEIPEKYAKLFAHENPFADELAAEWGIE